VNPNRFDRRRFLFGTGATLALPMLEAFAPRTAFGQSMPAPKRLLIIAHQDGRLAGDGLMLNGVYNDSWSPAQVTGPLPTGAALSPMLAPLQSIRNEVVTVDGVDNLLRHVLPDTDNHIPAQNTVLTCRARVNGQVPAASFDYQMGLRLRANSSMRTAPLIMGTAADYTWRMGNTGVFFGPNGTAPDIVEPDPAAAITDLFGMPTSMMPPPPMPPPPTLKDRLVKQRKSVLDGVLGSFNTLRTQVNAADRTRLDNHADFVRALEQRASMPTDGGMTQMAMGCQRPDPSLVPSNLDSGGNAYLRGERDATMLPAIIENMVQAFACDVTRVQSLFFWNGDDPVFPTQYSGASPFVNNNWHTVIHGVPRIPENTSDAGDLTKTYNFYATTFTQIVQRLAAMTDTDGSRMLDNTLVLWVSEMGYGSVHAAYNIPVVMAGLKSAFPKGQGRHLVCNRRSMGDLLAQVMRMFGGTDMTYGDTGTLGQYATDLKADAGWPGYITSSTPLHSGALDL
jgi:hypothetical protein